MKTLILHLTASALAACLPCLVACRQLGPADNPLDRLEATFPTPDPRVGTAATPQPYYLPGFDPIPPIPVLGPPPCP